MITAPIRQANWLYIHIDTCGDSLSGSSLARA